MNESEQEQDFDFDDQTISDSQLAMIFAVCNPVNSVEAQISLALQILCGFSVEEITNAFLALMCFQSSRLDARVNRSSETVLFDEQDKSLWDRSLIERGNYYLVRATDGGGISGYHLEAGIAYCHTASTDENKWQHILQLYNQLILIEYSPVTALNRAFAFAKVYGHEKAVAEAEKLQLTDNNYYHELLGYLYSGIDIEKAVNYYEQAVRLTKSEMEKQTLQKEINRLRGKNCL